MINVLNHPTFKEGKCNTSFIEDNQELFNIIPKLDIELHLLEFLGNKAVNETQVFKKDFDVPIIPKVNQVSDLSGTKQI